MTEPSTDAREDIRDLVVRLLYDNRHVEPTVNDIMAVFARVQNLAKAQVTEPSAKARAQALAILQDASDEYGDNSIFDILNERDRQFLVRQLARALAEKDATLRDMQLRLLDEFVAELKALDPRPNQWRQTYPFSEAFVGIRALLTEKDAKLAEAIAGLKLWRDDYGKVHAKWREAQSDLAAMRRAQTLVGEDCALDEPNEGGEE